MNKPLFSALLLLAVCLSLSAQQTISRAEYWVDTDPGHGNATAIAFQQAQNAAIQLDIDLSALPAGLHHLGVRAAGNGRWSQTYVHPFVKVDLTAEQMQQVTAAEFWIDTDPGQGNATPFPFTPGQMQMSLTVSQIDTMAFGQHLLGVRVRRGMLWSQTYLHRFVTINRQSGPMHVERIEAYWDMDTENPVSIPFSVNADGVAEVGAFSLSTDHLTYGAHTLYLRAYADGVPSVLMNYPVCKNAIPRFELLEDNICLGDELLVLDMSEDVQPETTYEWDVDGDGKADYTDCGDLIHTYTRAGVYDVTLTVRTGDGCETTFTKQVIVNTLSAPSVSLSRSKSAVCAGEAVTFTARPTNGGQHPSYVWYRNDAVIEGETSDTLVLSDLANKDKIKVRVVADNPCASVKEAVSSAYTMTVYPSPEITLDFKSAYLISDKAFSLSGLGTPAGGTFYINGEETRLFNPARNEPGTYEVTYVVTNDNGCTAEQTITFTLSDILSGFTFPTDVRIWLIGSELHVENLPAGVTYALYTATGQFLYSGTAPVLTLPASGIYLIRLSTGETHKFIGY